MDKEQIILNYSKNEFMNFLMFDRNQDILKLFDSEGIEIFKRSEFKEDRICYILTYSNYKNELLKDASFLDLFLNTRLTSYYATLNNLENDTYDFILNRCISLNMEPKDIATLFSYFKIDYKLSKLDNWPYSIDMLYEVLKQDYDVKVGNKILNNYDIDLLSHDIDLHSFFIRVKQSVLEAQKKRNMDYKIIPDLSINPNMITNEMADYLWNKYNIFQIRFILNDAEYSTDISVLKNSIKLKEEGIINQYKNSNLVYPYNEIYENLTKYHEGRIQYDEGLSDDYSFNDYRRNCLKLVNKLNEKNLYENLLELLNEQGLDAVLIYLEKLSLNNLSNYIIDYHFEENYHNITLDMQELLKFYFNGNVLIDQDRVALYEKILNIDYLDEVEKIELHEELKKYNMQELFYDDMSYARQIVAEAIKEYSLSSETIKQYKDIELSKKYGVDVYKMDGEPFFGIVKTGTGKNNGDDMPTGHSFSLVGDGGLAVFGEVSDSTTYLYDSNDLNTEQIVHTFPYDSFTLYRPFETSDKGTSRVNTLIMPEDLVKTTASYNEILILEQGRVKTDIDSKIPKLKRIALYCFDAIKEQDIQNAKMNDTGIILIDTSKYQKNSLNFKSSHEDVDNWRYDYYNDDYESERYEAKRRV